MADIQPAIYIASASDCNYTFCRITKQTIIFAHDPSKIIYLQSLSGKYVSAF